jgi:transcriptional regulator with XRE-family HTH domain
MPRTRPAHPVDDAWRRRVRRALEDRGWEQLDLAKAAKCSPSVLSELLTGKKQSSPSVPDIHLALGWTPPLPPSLPEETEELLELWNSLDDLDKGRLLERARILAESTKKTK